MWRIRYDEPSTNYKEEYWNGDIFLDELLMDIIDAVKNKNVCPFDIIIQNLDGEYDERIEEVDDREEMWTINQIIDYIDDDEVFIEDRSLICKLKEIPSIKEIFDSITQ